MYICCYFWLQQFQYFYFHQAVDGITDFSKSFCGDSRWHNLLYKFQLCRSLGCQTVIWSNISPWSDKKLSSICSLLRWSLWPGLTVQ